MRLKKNIAIPITDVKRHLLSVIGDSDKKIYTNLMNVNTSDEGYGHVGVLIVSGGVLMNISYYVGLLLKIPYRTRMVTDYVKIRGGEDMGKWVTRNLEQKLYEGMYLKEKLTHQWI